MIAPPKRNKTLSTIALLFLIEALFAMGIAAFFLLIPDVSSHTSILFERLGLSTAMSSLLAIPPLLTAALAGLIFRGLWGLEAWARLAAIVFIFLLLLTAIVAITFLASFHLLDRINLRGSVLLLAGSLLIFIYLIRTSFELDQAAAESVSAPPLPQMPPPALTSPAAAISESDSPAWVPPPPHPAPTPSPVLPFDATRTHTMLSPAPTQQLPTATTQRTDTERPVAWLIVRTGPEIGQKFAIMPGHSLTLGRDPVRANALLSDPTVSSTHAQIRHEQGHLVLYDLNSTNGTFVHEQMVHDHELVDGDEIRLASTVLAFTTTP